MKVLAGLGRTQLWQRCRAPAHPGARSLRGVASARAPAGALAPAAPQCCSEDVLATPEVAAAAAAAAPQLLAQNHSEAAALVQVALLVTALVLVVAGETEAVAVVVVAVPELLATGATGLLAWELWLLLLLGLGGTFPKLLCWPAWLQKEAWHVWWMGSRGVRSLPVPLPASRQTTWALQPLVA